MAISILDKDTLKEVLTQSWKKDLNTTLDPAGGQHYERRPGGGTGGLYGALTDATDSVLVYERPSAPFVFKKETVLTETVDNINGTLTGPVTVSFTKTHTKSLTHNWKVTVGQKLSIKMSLKGKGDVIVVGGETTAEVGWESSISLEYSGSATTTETFTFSHSVPVYPPKGRVYRAILTCYSGEAKLPFSTNVSVTGETETWFIDRVNGHYRWYTDVGNMFSVYRLIDPRSPFSGDGAQGRVKAVTGETTVGLSVNFEVIILDVTPKPTSPGLSGSPGDEEGVVVMKIPVSPESPSSGHSLSDADDSPLRLRIRDRLRFHPESPGDPGSSTVK